MLRFNRCCRFFAGRLFRHGFGFGGGLFPFGFGDFAGNGFRLLRSLLGSGRCFLNRGLGFFHRFGFSRRCGFLSRLFRLRLRNVRFFRRLFGGRLGHLLAAAADNAGGDATFFDPLFLLAVLALRRGGLIKSLDVAFLNDAHMAFDFHAFRFEAFDQFLVFQPKFLCQFVNPYFRH